MLKPWALESMRKAWKAGAGLRAVLCLFERHDLNEGEVSDGGFLWRQCRRCGLDIVRQPWTQADSRASFAGWWV